MESERHLQRAERHAQLGLPVPSGTKHRLVKRIVLKLTWFLTRHQMEHNLAMVAAVATPTAVRSSTARAHSSSSREAVPESNCTTEDSRTPRIFRSIVRFRHS
ncbi:MAG: hypothetical protein ACKOIA_01795 [Acidimicrobiia bacterium]